MDLNFLISNINICLKKKKFTLLQRRSKLVLEVLDCLWDSKIIIGYTILNKKFIKIYLKFDNSGNSLIKKLFLISVPGRRQFIKVFGLKKFNSQNNNFFLLKTSKGILNHTKAINENVGGELLLKICI